LILLHSGTLSQPYEYSEDKLSYSRLYSKTQLVGDTNNLALECVQTLFKKFEWLSSNMKDILKTEQDAFIAGKYKPGPTGVRIYYS
jgi:hypothetical protein